MEQRFLNFFTDLTKILFGVMLSFNVALLINNKIEQEAFFHWIGFWIFVYVLVNIVIIIASHNPKK